MNKIEKQFADYMNMMAAPISKEYHAEITRQVGELIFLKYRSSVYSVMVKPSGNIDKKTIRKESFIGDTQ